MLNEFSAQPLDRNIKISSDLEITGKNDYEGSGDIIFPVDQHQSYSIIIKNTTTSAYTLAYKIDVSANPKDNPDQVWVEQVAEATLAQNVVAIIEENAVGKKVRLRFKNNTEDEVIKAFVSVRLDPHKF